MHDTNLGRKSYLETMLSGVDTAEDHFKSSKGWGRLGWVDDGQGVDMAQVHPHHTDEDEDHQTQIRVNVGVG